MPYTLLTALMLTMTATAEKSALSEEENEMSLYEIIYDYDSEYDSERNCTEMFEGTWTELHEEIKNMRRNECYNITASALYDEED